mgnify:CR=1 FL=1
MSTPTSSSASIGWWGRRSATSLAATLSKPGAFAPTARRSRDSSSTASPIAAILLALDNFACGSSREGAVWALKQKGFRAVLAPSFGDIFFNNCFQNGVLPVVLAASDVRAIAREVEADPEHHQVTVDLAREIVIAPDGREIPFRIDGLRRRALLEGLDDIALTLRHEAEIASFQARDRGERPWIWAVEQGDRR